MGSSNLLPNLRSGCGVLCRRCSCASLLSAASRCSALRGARCRRRPADQAAEAVLRRRAGGPARARGHQRPGLHAVRDRRRLRRRHPADAAGRRPLAASTATLTARSRRRTSRWRTQRSSRCAWPSTPNPENTVVGDARGQALAVEQRPRRPRRAARALQGPGLHRRRARSTPTTCSRAVAQDRPARLPDGACGHFSTASPAVPVQEDPAGRHVDDPVRPAPQYNPKAAVRVRLTIKVSAGR